MWKWIVLGVLAVVVIIGQVAGIYFGYIQPKAKKAAQEKQRIEEKQNRKIGQEFTLDDGKAVKIKLATITDTKYGRSVYLDINYSGGSLDNLKPKVFSNSNQLDGNRTVGGASMEFSGLATGVPVESYYLIFEDGNRVYIGDAVYKADYGPSNGQEGNLFRQEETVQDPSYNPPPPQNTHCTSIDWGVSTSTDCYSN